MKLIKFSSMVILVSNNDLAHKIYSMLSDSKYHAFDVEICDAEFNLPVIGNEIKLFDCLSPKPLNSFKFSEKFHNRRNEETIKTFDTMISSLKELSDFSYLMINNSNKRGATAIYLAQDKHGFRYFDDMLMFKNKIVSIFRGYTGTHPDVFIGLNTEANSITLKYHEDQYKFDIGEEFEYADVFMTALLRGSLN